jgi:hypothetical protein
MMGGIKAQYDCIKVLSETEFYYDLKMIDVPILVMHGEDDQICPFATAGARSVLLLKHGTLKSVLVHLGILNRRPRGREARMPYFKRFLVTDEMMGYTSAAVQTVCPQMHQNRHD